MKKTTNINEIIAEIKEYQEMQEALKAEIENLKAQAIEYLNENNISEYVNMNDGSRITYKEIIQQRFNTTDFKKDFLDIYKEYCKPSSYMKFTCN